MPVAACVEEVNELEVAVAEPSVGELLRERMEAFDEAVGASNVIEIDGITPSGNVKVINHDSKDAYEVDVDTIVKTSPRYFDLCSCIWCICQGLWSFAYCWLF